MATKFTVPNDKGPDFDNDPYGDLVNVNPDDEVDLGDIAEPVFKMGDRL